MNRLDAREAVNSEEEAVQPHGPVPFRPEEDEEDEDEEERRAVTHKVLTLEKTHSQDSLTEVEERERK